MGIIDGVLGLVPHYAEAGLTAATTTVDVATDSAVIVVDDVAETVDGALGALGLGSLFG